MRLQKMMDLCACRGVKNLKAEYFNATRRRAGTSTYEHDEEEDDR